MNLKILAFVGMLACVGVPALAEETDGPEYTEEEIIEEIEESRMLSARMTCDEIAERIEELRDEIKSEPDLESELNMMLARQRTQCTTKSERRPVRNYARVNTVQDVKTEVIEAAEEVPTEEAIASESAPEEVAAAEVVTEQQAAENVARGLCPDGAKPNKFGCCAGERFKEVATMQYACCPKDGDGDCFEPLKK